MGKAAKFIFGAIIGAVATALLTPVSGKRAREQASKIAKKAGLDSKKLSSVADFVVKKGREFLDEAKIQGKKNPRKDIPKK